MQQLGLGHLEPLDGAPGQPLPRHRHLGHRGGGPSRGDQELRWRVGLDAGLLDRPPHPAAHRLELAPAQRVGGRARLGQDDRPQVQRVHLLDVAAERQDHLGAAAADVRDGAGVIAEIEAARRALKRQLGLLLLGDHAHPQPGLGAHPVHELPAVGGVANGARGDHRHALDAAPARDLRHPPERRDRAPYGAARQTSLAVEPGRQTRHVPLVVQGAQRSVGRRLDDQRPDRVRADIDDTKDSLLHAAATGPVSVRSGPRARRIPARRGALLTDTTP